MSEVWDIYTKMEISASHQLLGGEYKGKCMNLHGHNYKVEIWASAKKLNKQGMIINFDVIKATINKLDHTHLNTVMNDDLPTAEHMAKWIYGQLMKLTNNTISYRIRVWETDSAYAEYKAVSGD
jgi:6-pyruvoyltetrahydropterin/6-carboxytetrahydropterin synthase